MPREAVGESFDVAHGREVVLGHSLPEDHFGGVGEAEVDAALSVYADRDEFAVVGHAFVAQRIQLVDGDDVGWKSGEVGFGCEVGPGKRVLGVLVGWVVGDHEHVHHGAIDEVPVVFDHGRQFSQLAAVGPAVAAADVGDHRVDPVDGVEVSVPLGLQCGREYEVSTAGLALQHDRGNAELVAVVVDPFQRAGAVVEASRERMHSFGTVGVAEVNADDNHASRGQVFAPLLVDLRERVENSHAATVDVDNAR